MTDSAPDGLFPALVIDCHCSLLACRSQGKLWPAVMMIIEIKITTNGFFVHVCTVAIAADEGGGGSQLSQGLLIDWCLMQDDWCVFRLSRAEARPGFSRLSQCYSFIKAESYSGHRSWQWQTNIMSGRVDNDVMNVRVTGWRGINICKAAGGWWEIAVMAGFFFPPLMRPWLYGLALMHCNIVKHPQNRWMWYVNYVSRESQFPDRRVVFDCDPFFIITFRDMSTNHSSVVMWTLICLQSSDSLIFTHFFFFLLFFLSPHLSVSANLLTRSLIITQHW